MRKNLKENGFGSKFREDFYEKIDIICCDWGAK
jgi:hypothetical protein